MRFALVPHPDTPCRALTAIEVEVERTASKLSLTYVATGNVADVRWPPLASSQHTDELWRHTCFELFARVQGEPAYIEYNFAPSTQWALYGFQAYRQELRLRRLPPPVLRVEASAQAFTLIAEVDAPFAPFNPTIHLGLSAVIEETNGAKSYWALAHAPGQPDFHHADAFAATLEPL